MSAVTMLTDRHATTERIPDICVQERRVSRPYPVGPTLEIER